MKAARLKKRSSPGAKILRQDPETTAYTLMTRHQPGWIDRRLAQDTWEELFLLQGIT